MAYLLKKGVKEHKIARWFDGKKENMTALRQRERRGFYALQTSRCTGWDCPRASVLVMFREVRSEKFYTQTVAVFCVCLNRS